jgi:hypothetical protein
MRQACPQTQLGHRRPIFAVPRDMNFGVASLLVADIVAKVPNCPAPNFLAVKKSDRRPPNDVASITLPRSPVSLSSGDEVPHILTRKSRLRSKEFLIASAKRDRLLTNNLLRIERWFAEKFRR